VQIEPDLPRLLGVEPPEEERRARCRFQPYFDEAVIDPGNDRPVGRVRCVDVGDSGEEG
jgi:hypothetical protein